MRRFVPLLLLFSAIPASAAAAPPRLLTPDEALARDAERYAARFGVGAEDALLALRKQFASTAITDRLRTQYRERLAGIYIEHQPRWGIVVVLTGTAAPPPMVIEEGGQSFPVRFVTGAPVTRDVALQVLDANRATLAQAVPGYRGAGYDTRTGRLIVMQRPGIDPRSADELASALYDRLGIPVRVRRLEASMANSAAVGGGRVEGPDNGRRWVCTTGYVVTDGARSGVTTAAHCPDTLTWRAPDGEERLLEFAGGWGTAYRDIQIHTRIGPAEPVFFSDRPKTEVRPVTSWITKPMTRSGDWLCLRGESSGYGCSEVELTDFAPPAELCGGLCSTSWVTVRGPECRRGDSGSPVFLGTTAYGVLKGGAYLAGGACAFYYYQSVDYLPEGWRLLTANR